MKPWHKKRHKTHISKTGSILKEKIGQESNSWTVYRIYRQLISEEGTFLWLQGGDLEAENESEIIAAQDQALQSKYYATKMLKTGTDGKCTDFNNMMTKQTILLVYQRALSC